MSLMLAIAGVLHKQSAAYPKPQFVGSSASSMYVAQGGVQSITLPAGCAIGDLLIISSAVQYNASAVLPAGWTLLASTSFGVNPARLNAAVFRHVVTSADIAVGALSVALTYSAGNAAQSTLQVMAYRSVSGVDSVGAFAIGVIPRAAASATVALAAASAASGGIAHISAFDTVFAGATLEASATRTFVEGARPSGVSGADARALYAPVPSAGAVAGPSVTFAASAMSDNYCAAILLVLRDLAPAPILVTGTLKATATVGQPYSSTLTLAGDFVAPVTIDAASGTIPAWLTPSVSGSTVTFAGTPDSDDAVSFTPRATDANGQKAVGSAQSIEVKEAAAFPTVVQFAQFNGGAQSSPSVALPTAPTPGNWIVILAGWCHSGIARTPLGTGWTAWPLGMQSLGTNINGAVWARKAVAGDTQAFGLSTTDTPVYNGFVVYEIAGTDGSLNNGVFVSQTTKAASITLNPTVSGLALVLRYMFAGTSGAADSLTFSGITRDAIATTPVVYSTALSGHADATSGTALTATITDNTHSPRADTQCMLGVVLGGA